MGTNGRDYYPSGDLRVSDVERDRALSELSEALQAGRITADEFKQRSEQVLEARTGKELTVPLADLPPDRAPSPDSTALQRPRPIRAPVVAFGAAALATILTGVSITNATLTGPTLQQREQIQHMMALQGISIPLPPASGFDWAGTITPAVFAVLLVLLIVYLRVTRADHP
ncbi:MAG: DUF1707 domain-containing protein [Streptosporangiaceae bacterium]|jgi:hypothetical protein